VDPKSIVCEFFRHGQCTKGFKCKFAHDLSVERKGAKIDLYSDQRDVKGGDGDEKEEVRFAVLWGTTSHSGCTLLTHMPHWLGKSGLLCQHPACSAGISSFCASQGMDDWDQETLEKVVKEKHGNEKPSNATNIICKFFLDAVEKKQYGW
jgi:hypothetical protein